MAYSQQTPSPYYQGGYKSDPYHQGPYPPSGSYQAVPQYYPAPVQQSSTNVIVVSQPQACSRTYHVVENEAPNHLLHFIITLFCPWWIFVWICLCVIYGC
eukprot:Em0003g1300a